MDDFEFAVPEFETYKRDPLWYVYFILIVLIILAIAILTSNYSFSAIIVLSCLAILFRGMRKPGIIMVAIHSDGIYVQNKHYNFEDIKSFSITKLGQQDYLIFSPKGQLQIPLKIPITEPESVRNKLNKLLTEVEYQESLTDLFIRILKI